MHKILRLTFLLSFLSGYLHSQPCKEIVGYYCDWQWYDRNHLVNPMTVDYSKYTILNYAFLNPQTDGTVVLYDAWADENLLQGPMNWSTNTHDSTQSLPYQAHQNNVKLLMSVGGWTLSGNFPAIAADPLKRSIFANSCVQLISTYDFDGIDIDWEYPANATDKSNYTIFLQQLRDTLTAITQRTGKSYLLTAALPAGPSNMVNIDWTALSSTLDILNIMTYDFFGSWDNNANHNAPLYVPLQGDAAFNCDVAIQTLITQYNVPPGKITMGIPFYGRAVQTIGAPALFGPILHQPDNITFPEDDGSPQFYNIVERMNLFSAYYDQQSQVPFLLGNNSLNTFLSYDDSLSVALKGQYILNSNLRGAIVWEISGDVFETAPGSGVIASTPLADALNSALCMIQTSVNYPTTEFVSVFPNPAQEYFVLKNVSSSCSITIEDITGKHMLEIKNYQGEQVNISHWEKGVYIIRTPEEKNKSVKKLVVE